MVPHNPHGPVYRVENDRPVDFSDEGNASVEYHGVDELSPALRSCVFLPDSAVTRHNERRVLLMYHVPRGRRYEAVLTFHVRTREDLRTNDRWKQVLVPSNPGKAEADVTQHGQNQTDWSCRIHFTSDSGQFDRAIWVDPTFTDPAIEEIRFNRAEVFDVTGQPT
jgi:hypothetical protein